MTSTPQDAWEHAKAKAGNLTRAEVERRLEVAKRGTLEKNALKWRLTQLVAGRF